MGAETKPRTFSIWTRLRRAAPVAPLPEPVSEPAAVGALGEEMWRDLTERFVHPAHRPPPRPEPVAPSSGPSVAELVEARARAKALAPPRRQSLPSETARGPLELVV